MIITRIKEQNIGGHRRPKRATPPKMSIPLVIKKYVRNKYRNVVPLLKNADSAAFPKRGKANNREPNKKKYPNFEKSPPPIKGMNTPNKRILKKINLNFISGAKRNLCDLKFCFQFNLFPRLSKNHQKMRKVPYDGFSNVH